MDVRLKLIFVSKAYARYVLLIASAAVRILGDRSNGSVAQRARSFPNAVVVTLVKSASLHLSGPLFDRITQLFFIHYSFCVDRGRGFDTAQVQFRNHRFLKFYCHNQMRKFLFKLLVFYLTFLIFQDLLFHNLQIFCQFLHHGGIILFQSFHGIIFGFFEYSGAQIFFTFFLGFYRSIFYGRIARISSEI